MTYIIAAIVVIALIGLWAIIMDSFVWLPALEKREAEKGLYWDGIRHIRKDGTIVDAG